MVLAKSMFILLNEPSFFTFFVPLTCLDHIPFELLLFGPTRYEISEKIRALACPLFEISVPLKFTFMTWGYAQPAPFHKHVIPLDRGATSLANQATLSSAVVVLVKWCWLCITPCHFTNTRHDIVGLNRFPLPLG